jgi:hypothetical protein
VPGLTEAVKQSLDAKAHHEEIERLVEGGQDGVRPWGLGWTVRLGGEGGQDGVRPWGLGWTVRLGGERRWGWRVC